MFFYKGLVFKKNWRFRSRWSLKALNQILHHCFFRIRKMPLHSTLMPSIVPPARGWKIKRSELRLSGDDPPDSTTSLKCILVFLKRVQSSSEHIQKWKVGIQRTHNSYKTNHLRHSAVDGHFTKVNVTAIMYTRKKNTDSFKSHSETCFQTTTQKGGKQQKYPNSKWWNLKGFSATELFVWKLPKATLSATFQAF